MLTFEEIDELLDGPHAATVGTTSHASVLVAASAFGWRDRSVRYVGVPADALPALAIARGAGAPAGALAIVRVLPGGVAEVRRVTGPVGLDPIDRESSRSLGASVHAAAEAARAAGLPGDVAAVVVRGCFGGSLSLHRRSALALGIFRRWVPLRDERIGGLFRRASGEHPGPRAR